MSNSLFGFEVGQGVLSFLESDMTAPVIDEFYDGGELYMLGNELNDRIRTRTAHDTGALREDETFEINTDKSSKDLIVFYVTDTHQIDEWGRTYARFIEGEPLGFTSPTIYNPSQMYHRMETEDMEVIDMWGGVQAQKGLDKHVASFNLSAP
jgi:hypothetical protein